MSASEPLTKASSGDRIILSGSTFNTIVDAINGQKNAQINVGSESPDPVGAAGLVPVRNDSGSDVDRYGILGIDSPLFSPTDNLASFKSHVLLKGVTPTLAAHRGKFVIAEGPIKSGKIGMCRLLGVCPVQVNVLADKIDYADVEVDSSYTLARLRTIPSGSAQILWRETGTGIKWAIVRLGSPAPTTRLALVTKDGGVAGDASTNCTWTYTVKDLDDTTILKKYVGSNFFDATGMTPEHGRFKMTNYRYAGETYAYPYAGGTSSETTSRFALVGYDKDGGLRLLQAFGEFPYDDGTT